MTRKFPAAVGALLCAAVAWAGQPVQVSVKWGELGPRIMDKKIVLVLPDGTRVQGRVQGVDPAGLRLDISKTSDKRVQPKGAHAIPRQSVSMVRVTEYRGTGRLLLTAGVIATAGALVAIGTRESVITEGPMVIIGPAIGVAGTAGLGVAGYYAGKALDKRVTDIRIAPGD